MFTGFLTIIENGKDKIDVTAPVIEDSNPIDVIRRLYPLREDKHEGIILLDSNLWEFSEIINLNNFIETE